MKKSNDFSPDIILYIIILYILFVIHVPWIEISVILSLIFGIPILIRFYVWVKDRRKQSIRNFNNFLDQAILTLRANSTSYEGFNFPEGFNYWYEISTDNRTLNSFSRLKPWLGWRTKRYNRFCNQIDTMVRSFRGKAREQRIIQRIHTPNGQEYVLEDKYESFSETQRNDLLRNRDLTDDIESIERLRRQLPNKSRKLLNKFQRLRNRWNR